MKKHFLAAVLTSLVLSPRPASAKFIGADPPKLCSTCPTCKCSKKSAVSVPSDTSTGISASEGNMTESVPISTAPSSLNLTLNYNSYNSDGSRATVNTGIGYGWTDSYNDFLFSQAGQFFRYDGEGRVTRFAQGPGGTYITDPGYFETLVPGGGGFTLTQKDKTQYTYGTVPGTPFQVGGPVYRLTSIVDRNGNTTTLTYSGGELQTVADTYGRTLTFSYNAGHLASVTDPGGRVTTFTYDSTGQKLTQVTDPNGNSIKYSYNAYYQMSSKTDKAGRTFTYTYSSGAPGDPLEVKDSSNSSNATLSNPGAWGTNSTSLAMNQQRVYTPATTTNTDGRGNKWTYTYNSEGYLTQTGAPDGSLTSYTYDPATLKISSVTNANGNTTNYTYDSQGNLLTTTDALGHLTTYTYDPTYNMMTSMTDPRGRVTTYTIDPGTGNLTQETDPLGQTESWTYDSHGSVLTHTDKDGNTTTNTYDAYEDLVTTTDPLGNQTTMTYDPDGNVLTRTDADGHTTTYQYDGLNRLITTTDATGHTDQTVYDGEGNRIQTIDRDGHTTTYQYDQRQRLTKMTDALSHSESYTYDGNDNRLTLTDRDGHVTTSAYDTQNRQNKVTDALGHATTYVYDPVGNLTSQTDANGHTTSYQYDALNRRSTMTDALGEETQYFYDTGTFTGPVNGINCVQCGATPGSSLVTEKIDPDGTASLHAGTTFYKYDALNRSIIVDQRTGCLGAGCSDTITPGSDGVTTNTYDPDGNRLSTTQPDGVVTNYQYDADNRMIQETVVETDSEPNDVTTTTYDGVGNVITVTAANGNVTTNTYDSLNRLITMTDIVGPAVPSPITSYTYDAVGNRASATDGNGNTTSYGYDALNRTITVTDPLSMTTTTVYDSVGNVLSVTDRNGNVTTYTYDAINRRTKMTDALSESTQWAYDSVGNMITQTDANSHATKYTYDAVNRPLKETYPDNLSRSYTYDAASNLITRADQLGRTTNYAYSDLYFLLSRTYPSAINDFFTYDLSGRMLTALRGSWTDTFQYDSANRITGATQNGQSIGYVYDIPARTRQLTYPGGRVITETTDYRSRMAQIDDSVSPLSIVQYTYDYGNRVTTRTYRNGTSAAFTYNNNDWISSIQHSGAIGGFTYSYDNEGNKQYEENSTSLPSGCFGYDAAYRLTSYGAGTLSSTSPCTITSPPVPPTQTSYSLDPVGNWKSKTTNSITQNRTYNSDNELTEIGSTAITYDADGNTLNDGTYTYTYDEENRLTSVTRNSGHAVVGQYQYDALGRRVQKIADPNGASTTTLYFYDSARIIEEQNTSNITQATYVYGNGMDEVLTMARGGQAYYYHENSLGSVEAVTDSTGTPVERYTYDAYGAVTVDNGTFSVVPPNTWGTPHSAIGNPWMFTGRQLDEETGLYFYRARYYDTVKGRFLQRDPAEAADSTNLYRYVKDNPANLVDPSGLKATYFFNEGYNWAIWSPGAFIGPIRVKDAGYIVTGSTWVQVFVEVDDCSITFKSAIDKSSPPNQVKIPGRLSLPGTDFSYAANATAIDVPEACACCGKKVPGLLIITGHQYSSSGNAAVNVAGGAGVTPGLTFGNAKESSRITNYRIVCPTGGDNAPTWRYPENPKGTQNIDEYHAPQLVLNDEFGFNSPQKVK